jgi:RNA polymerase sigma-70 factor (ECF subfamily)
VELNRAVAVAMAEGASTGLALLDRLAGVNELATNHLYHAARGDMLARLGRDRDATLAYQRALELTNTSVERRFLERRLHSFGEPSD